jgi:hypothetical protein
VHICIGDPPRDIHIDGQFADWDVVPKRTDPSRASQLDPVVYDGHPPAPDVHDTTSTTDQCIIRPDIWNPTVDIVQYALSHDDEHVYAYFKVTW